MNRGPGRLRIIGGRWRSRVVDFADSAGVRPTPDRVRQTLFDWLAPRIEGAIVLDLFAGSGALGLEALSRGAGLTTFVETGVEQVGHIRSALRKLGSEAADVRNEDGLALLSRSAQRYDVVMLDPPYDSPLLDHALAALPRVLKPGNRVYLEWPKSRELVLPAGWTLLREKQAGLVRFGLATYSSVELDP